MQRRNEVKMIFDTHAHYDDEAFDLDREEILNNLKNEGIINVVNIGASLESSKSSIALAKKFDFVHAAVGVHPDQTKELNEENFNSLCEMAKEEKVVAIGEIGLDYYWDATDREIQKFWFKKQLHLAMEEKLPVIIHSRDAAADTLEMMKEAVAYAKERNKTLTGIIHCFSYGTEIADYYLKQGFYLGIGGVVTFKNGRKLKEVVEMAPLTSLVLETDCPYLSPVPYRGKRNYSGYLSHVVEEIALIKNVSVEEVIRQTTENARKVYQM